MRAHRLTALAALALLAAAGTATASSHMDAPLITLDDAANTTDVYAFVSQIGGIKYLTTALAVYPFEEPGIGPNKFNFDDAVRYQINVATGPDLAAGRATYSYTIQFNTKYRNRGTILQSYTGVIQDVGDPAQNLLQDYVVTRTDNRTGTTESLGGGLVPPNNQGNATPEYNLLAGEGPAKDGVASRPQLDKYTAQTSLAIGRGHHVFAGQRDDGFYADIQAVFDLLRLRSPGMDSQKGFNVHTIVLSIPVGQIGGEMQQVGVYGATYRRQVVVQPFVDQPRPLLFGQFVQVARQGNPLFCEAFIAIADKDRYSQTTPAQDAALFRRYAEQPELARLLNALVFAGSPIPGIETGRTDLVGIFIPDLIKVDLSTAAVPLAGGGPGHPTNPDDPAFSRLSVFGGDTTYSPLQGTAIPSGWPNGRRFGDDVLDIGVSAVISDLRVSPPVIRTAGDNVNGNDIAYNKVFPYAATPLNGRNHRHE